MINKQLENKISSREVAKMMDLKHHSDLLRKIDAINKSFNQSKIAFVKYWTESTYKDAKGENRREFQITKRGCEFLAHKTTGTKGNLFTDRYMDKFEMMENQLKNNVPIALENMQGMAFLAENMQLIGQALQGLQAFTLGIQEYVKDSIQAKDYQIDQVMDLVGIRSKNKHRLVSKLKDTLLEKYGESVQASDIRFKNAKNKVFKEFKVYKWEDISAKQYNSVEAFIEEAF